MNTAVHPFRNRTAEEKRNEDSSIVNACQHSMCVCLSDDFFFIPNIRQAFNTQWLTDLSPPINDAADCLRLLRVQYTNAFLVVHSHCTRSIWSKRIEKKNAMHSLSLWPVAETNADPTKWFIFTGLMTHETLDLINPKPTHNSSRQSIYHSGQWVEN